MQTAQLKNASRVMRLAGAWHTSGKQSVIINNSGKRYTYDELRSIVPAQQKPEPTLFQAKPQALPTSSKPNCYEDVEIPVPMPVPLLCALGKTNKGFLQGVSTQRNTSMATLARDLIGTAKEFARLGQTTNEDAYTLFIDACRRCSPGNRWDEKEWASIWKSAEDSNPSPSNNQASPEAVENCIKSWYWKEFGKKPSSPAPPGSNVLTHPRFSKPPLAPIVREEIAKNPTAEEKREAIRQIEATTGHHIKEVEREWREQIGQQQEADELAEARHSLNKLLKQDRLNPLDYLWGDGGRLARALVQTAEAMPAAPGLLFTALLPTAAACIGTAARVIVNPRSKYTQLCNFWTVGLGRSGQLKTPTQSIVTEPLVDLEIAAAETYARAEEIYRAELAEWKKDKAGDGDPPTQPKRKRYLTTDATVESLERVHAENPRGLFVFTDELAGEFKAENAYRSGKGADKEKKLSQWNGSAIIVDRKERTVALKRSAINRTGGCQWDVWAELMGSGDDSNGFFCRWLVCGEESPRRYINFSAGTADTGIGDLLKNLYQALEQLPEADYLLSDDAQRIFEPWQHYLVDLEATAKTSAMTNLYPKIEAYTSRFALWLHLVNATLACERPAPTISGATMERAIALARYYLNQAESILLTYSPQAGLTGILKQIQDYARKKPDGVKPGKLSAGIKAIRKKIEAKQLTVEDLYHHCQHLANEGYGTFVDGVYQAVDRQLTDVDRRSTSTKSPETTESRHSGKLADDRQLTGVDQRSTAENKPHQSIGAKNTTPVDQLTVPGFESSQKTRAAKTSTSSGQLVNSVNQRSTNGAKNPTESAVDPVDRAVNQQSTSSQPQLKPGALVTPVESIEPPTPPATTGTPAQLNEDEEKLVSQLVQAARKALWLGDKTLAEKIWKRVKNNPNLKKAVKAALTVEGNDAFKALLVASSPTDPAAKTDSPIAPTQSQQPTSPPESQPESQQPVALSHSGPEPETIGPADAEKMRDIACVWWPEYYPEQLQTLLTQMFGRGEPGDKYDRATIEEWLETEEEAVRERIWELMRRHSENSC